MKFLRSKIIFFFGFIHSFFSVEIPKDLYGLKGKDLINFNSGVKAD